MPLVRVVFGIVLGLITTAEAIGGTCSWTLVSVVCLLVATNAALAEKWI